MGDFSVLRQRINTGLSGLLKAAPALELPSEASVQKTLPQVREASLTSQRSPFPLRSLEPALVNTYLRSYLMSYDGRFRLTIDREMRFYAVDKHYRPYRNYASDHAVVVEVKYESEDDVHYDRVGQHLPFRLGKNSKYVNGILLTGNV